MLSTQVLLVIYYLGFGYAIFLGWAGIAFEVLLNARSEEKRARLRRIGRALLVIGVAHPALAFTGRDVVRQLRTDHDDEPVRPTRAADALAALSLVLAVPPCVFAVAT